LGGFGWDNREIFKGLSVSARLDIMMFLIRNRRIAHMPKKDLPAGVSVRRATMDDADMVLKLVNDLAVYEKLSPPDVAAQKRLVRDMSGDKPRIEVYIAEYDGKPAGYAIVLESYSSFLALPSLYVEDLFVMPDYRKKKLGYALFVTMAREAVRRGCGRMEWTALDWNTLATDFYKRVGGRHVADLQFFRMLRPEMEKLADGG
jgi:GNAT superfamily N-acetyltransferase